MLSNRDRDWARWTGLGLWRDSWSAMSLVDVSLYRMRIGELPDSCSFVLAWTAA
jgi:hypothetical protein